MGKLRTIIVGVALAVGLVGAGAPAMAQIAGQTHCGLASPSGGIVPTQFYDPFNPNPISGATVTLTLERYTGSGPSEKTQQVNFYFTAPPGTPVGPTGFQILDSGGQNVLYVDNGSGLGQGAPVLSLSSSIPTGTIGYNFGANDDYIDSPPVTVSIRLPAGLDLANGLNVQFNIVYSCNGTGSHFANVTNGSIINALTLPVKVLSALQANFAGPAIDFKDVQLAGTAGHPISGYLAPTTGPGFINVKSSGPYTVALTSANSWLLKNGASGANNQIAYSLRFLGQPLTGSSTFTPVQCTRAGVIAGEGLPLRATLAEAGNTKTVASYLDQLTVTITPTNFSGATADCSSIL